MRKRKDFYAFVLSLISAQEPIHRRAIRQACREHFHISDNEWAERMRNGRDLKYSNRLDFVIQDLRDVGLIDLNNSLFRVTAIGREAKSWEESDLVEYVKQGLSELRKNKRDQPKRKVRDGGMRKEMQRKMSMPKIIRRGAIAMVCASILGLLLSDEHDMFYGLLLLISMLLLLWKKRKIAASATDPETRRPKSCLNPIPDTPEAEPTKPTSLSEPEHMPIEPPKKPMPIAAKPSGLTPDGQEPSGSKSVDEKILYFEKYLGVIEKKHGITAKERLRSDVEDLFGSGPESAGNKKGRIVELFEECKKNGRPQKVNGLVVGRVQSGKTQNYIGLMLKAIDEGYNVIIVLTSNNNELVRQTRNRIFGGGDETGAFAVVGYKNYIENEFWKTNGRLDNNYQALEDGRAFVGVAQKEQLGDGGHLPRIRRWFEGAGDNRQKMKVLLIDDEADYASMNSWAGKKVWGLTDVQNLIYKIERFRDSTQDPRIQRRCAFLIAWVQWLITNPPVLTEPQVNQLQEILRLPHTDAYRYLVSNDLFEEDEELQAILRFSWRPNLRAIQWFFEEVSTPTDFQNLLKYMYLQRERSTINKSIVEMCATGCPQMVYVGYTATPFANLINESPTDNPLYPDFAQSLSLSPEYFGFDRIFGDTSYAAARMDIVRDIPDQESAKGEIEETPTLRNAIAWAFCSAAARRCIHCGDKNERTTMLINIARDVDHHGRMKEAVKRYIRKKVVDVDALIQECRQLWQIEVERFNLSKFQESASDWPVEVRIKDWKVEDWPKIEEGIHYFCGCPTRVNVVALNSDDANRDDARLFREGVNERDSLWIVCGGDAIARGLTLEGLSVSYYDRVSETTCVDTMAQMGRWFGYRNGYQLLPRIWMPKETERKMKEACYTENRLHEEIKKAFAARVDVSDPNHYLPLCVRSQRLTGRDAALSTISMFRLSDVVVQLSRKREDIKGSWEVLRRFVRDRFGAQFDRLATAYPYARFPYWKGLKSDVVRDFLTAAKQFVPKQTEIIFDELIKIIETNNTINWDVVIADVDSDLPSYDLGEGVVVRPSGVKEDGVVGDIVEFKRKTQDYLAYLAGYSKKDLANVDSAVRRAFGREQRRGARAEYRDMAYVVTGDCYPKLQLFLVRPSDAVSSDKSIPLVKYAFEWPGSDRGEEYVNCILGDRELAGAMNNRSCDSPEDGLTEEKKKELLNALNVLANKPCPWYCLRPYKNSQEGDFWSLEEIKRLGFGPNDEDAVIQFVTENGWNKEEAEKCDWYVLAPASFAEQGGIVAAVREQYIKCAKEALKESLKKKEKGAKLPGDQLRRNANSVWAMKGYPSVDEKIDPILLENRTIPYSWCNDKKQQERALAAIDELEKQGFEAERKSNLWSYRLAEESVASEVSGPEGARPSGRLEEMPSSGTMAVPNDEALNGNARALQAPAPARPEGRNPEKVRHPDGMGGCLTEEEKNKIKRILESLATKPCPWYKRADLLKDLLSEVSIENRDEAFCAIIIDFVVNENGWKRESCEACRDDEVLAPASFVGEKESIVEAIRAKYLDCVVGCVEELGKDHPEGRWLATTLLVDIYNKMSCGVTEIPQEGNPSGGMKWWYMHKVKGIIVEIPSKENCRAWDGPENERIGVVKDFHNRKLDLLGKLEGRGVGCQIEKGGYEYRFFYSVKTSDSEEKKEEEMETRAERARRPRGQNERCSLSEENKKKIQHTLNGLAKKPFPWYTKDLLLRKLFDLSELSNVNEDSPVLKRRVLDFVVNENGWKRESGAADQDDEVLAPASFVGENRSIREAARAQYKKVQCGILVIPDKGRDPDGKDLKKEQREFLDKLRRAWTRRRRIVVELRPLDNDDGYRYFYYPGIFDPAAPVDENGDESLKNWESNIDCAVEMVVDEMDIRYSKQQGLLWEDLRAAIVNAKIGE